MATVGTVEQGLLDRPLRDCKGVDILNKTTNILINYLRLKAFFVLCCCATQVFLLMCPSTLIKSLLSINRTNDTCCTEKGNKKRKPAAAQWVQRKWTCHHVDIPTIRGTFSGAVAGSLQCLPGSIISLASHSLKMSYIHSNELREHALFPNFPAAAPTLIQMLKLCNSSPSTH